MADLFTSYDFHCHLGGCTSYQIVERHAGTKEAQRLERLAGEARRSHTLNGFLNGYFHAVEELQSRQAFLYDTMDEAVRSFAESHGDSRRCGLEIRWCPFLRAMPIPDQIAALRSGLKDAGLKYNVDTRLAMIAQRGDISHLSRIPFFLDLVDTVDVAGPENNAETRDPRWLPMVREVYREARRKGVQTTYHSGEGHVNDTIALLNADIPLVRLGHGTALRFVDSQMLTDNAHITFELCPEVHACTGVALVSEVVAFANTLLEHGVPFVFGSDNPAITGVSYHQQAAKLSDQLRKWANTHATRLHYVKN